MRSKGVLELRPGEPSARREHGHVIVPPCACGTPELLGCKSRLVPILVRVQGELGLYGPEPTIRLQWLVRFMEERWLSSQKLWISRSRRLVVLSRLRRSALRHKLTKECRLLVAPGKNGRQVSNMNFLI